jgi:hypothetical protein
MSYGTRPPDFRAAGASFRDNLGMNRTRVKAASSNNRVTVVVAAGWEEVAVAQAAISPFLETVKGNGAGSLVVACGDASVAEDHEALVAWVINAIGSTFASAETVTPTTTALSGWVRTRRSLTAWAAVDVEDKSDRLHKAWLRREVAEATTLIALNRIPTRDSHDPLVLGMWARFAHPRQRLGALIGDDQSGLRAEIATAVKPALCVLIGESRERPLVVVTTDQIAAELTGRAIQAIANPDPYGDRVGPWELPLIQRVTELNLGVSLPADMTFEAAWAGKPGEPGEQMLRATVQEICLALGVPLGAP